MKLGEIKKSIVDSSCDRGQLTSRGIERNNSDDLSGDRN